MASIHRMGYVARVVKQESWTRAQTIAALKAHVAEGHPATSEGIERAGNRQLTAAIRAHGGLTRVRALARLPAHLHTARPEARGADWLCDTMGRPCGLARWGRMGAVGFRVLHQPEDGTFWRKVEASGCPLLVSLWVTRDELVHAVEGRPGAYQLIPVDAAGAWIGDPPEIVFVTAPAP